MKEMFNQSVLKAFSAVLFALFLVLPAIAQQPETGSVPNVIQPGAPGEASRRLKSFPKATLPPHVAKDTEFMQGMIMHHAQAVEMVALIKDRTQNRNVRMIGERIGISQTDEIEFMQRWLTERNEKTEMTMPANSGGGHSHGHHGSASSEHSMPGMLSATEMEALRKSEGAEFDRLFLTGMIKHHEGALVMVKELFDTPGTAQDAALFKFATDVDNDQRMEIKTMQTLLDQKP